jgi:putative membrane protein
MIIFLLSGFLGIASLNLDINQPLLPLLSGLFGASSLILSISQKTLLPDQKIERIKIKENLRTRIKPAILSSIVSPIVGFLPGLGSSQAAIISSSIIKIDRRQFLILVGSINTFVMIISFLTLYLINKSRTGSAAIISDIMNLKLLDLFWIYGAIVISSLFCIFITLKLARLFAKNITKINYSKLSICIIIFLAILVFFFSGLLGFLVFLVSTVLGITCSYFEVRKGILMGCLLIPTILYYILL